MSTENNQMFHVVINENDEIVITYEDENSQANHDESLVEMVFEEECQQIEDNYEHEQFDGNEESENKAEEIEVVVYDCTNCDKTFLDVNDLVSHMTFCKMYTRITEIEDECQQMQDDDKICYCCEENYDSCHAGNIRCPECPKSFKNSDNFQRHVFLLHSDMQQYPCEICNARCPSEQILKIHTAHHHKRGKPFACKKCGKEFTQRYNVLRHIKYSGCDPGQAKKEYECNVCTKVFYAIDNLRSHLRTHLGEDSRDYQCPYCEKRFYGASTLTIHIGLHTGERPFACDLCQKVFKSNSDLRKHRRCHIGEKPNDCSICYRSFNCKRDINRHLKTHAGPHTCTICGKGFNQANQVISHGCPLCDQNFSSKLQLSKHLASDHSSTDVEYQCKHCDDKFLSLASLKRHITRKHIPKSLVCPTCVRKCFRKFNNSDSSTIVK